MANSVCINLDKTHTTFEVVFVQSIYGIVVWAECLQIPGIFGLNITKYQSNSKLWQIKYSEWSLLQIPIL